MSVDLERLTELAYSAAVEDGLWREWTFELVRQFGGRGALFWVIDPNRFDMCQSHMCFLDVDNEQVSAEYLSGPVADDPQMTRVCTAKRSEIYLDTDHVDLADPRTREYVKWQEATVGSRHHITSSVVLDCGVEAGVSLHFSAEAGPADAEARRQIEVLFPHFGRALRLGYRHGEATQESWWEGTAATGELPRVLLNRDGKVLRASPSAAAILARADGLSLVHDRLTCSDGSSAEALRGAIHAACKSPTGRAGSLAVRRKNGRAPYLVSTYPLVERRRFLSPYGASAMVCITDPSARFTGLSDQQKQMLCLTSRETEMADHLRNGHSVASASELMGITYNTAKLHLQSLFRKTNTSRQSELMMFLERLH